MVLERVAWALLLIDAEREHLFLLAPGRPPEVHYQAPGSIDAHLQRVLDAPGYSPAVVRTATWDVVAQNRAAATLMADFLSGAPEGCNVLRAMFCDVAVGALRAFCGRHVPRRRDARGCLTRSRTPG